MLNGAVGIGLLPLLLNLGLKGLGVVWPLEG
jgi:hypothetical protein